MKQLVIIGASGHGKVIADIAKKNGYEEILFLDDNDKLESCAGYPVVGKSEEVYGYKCDVAIGIGNAKIRKRIQNELEKAGVSLPVFVHPSAAIADGVTIGVGTVVVAGAVINPGAQIGKGCIINTCASVDHDCVVGDYVHVSVGAHLAGTVVVGECTWIGIGAVVSNNLNVAANCMIGAGATVVGNIEEEGTYVGTPAKKKY